MDEIKEILNKWKYADGYIHIEDAANEIQTLKKKWEREAVEKTVKKYQEWVVPNLNENDAKFMVEDGKNVIADVLNWCMICNKANGELTEDGVCGDCL